ncbi:MAG: DUF2283 domain-containing protein [Acidimicrobiia bacterium]|nr:DUF2283 domain-containing protein [Acidimicrobiia bacterium]
MAELRVTYDSRARAAYVAITASKVTATTEVLKDRIYFDLDSAGQLVGIEAVGISADSVPNLLGAIRDALLRSEAAMGDSREKLLAIAG